RRAAFRALPPADADVRFVAPGELPGDLGDQDAIVIDGPPPAQPLETLTALRSAVERGAALVAIGVAPAERDGFRSELPGVTAGPVPPVGEYYATVPPAHPHISDRVVQEFAVVDRFVPLIPHGAGTVILNVRLALRDLPAVVESALGSGRVVACGLGNSD